MHLVPDIRLHPINSQQDLPLLLEASLDAFFIGQVQRHQFFIAFQQIGDGTLGDAHPAVNEPLVDFWDRAMFLRLAIGRLP